MKRYLMLGDLTMGWSAEEGATDRTHTLESRKLGIGAGSKRKDADPAATHRSLKSLIADAKCEAERNPISAALDKTGWNRKAAARLLKVSYRTILYKIDQYEMHSPVAREDQAWDRAGCPQSTIPQ